MARSTKKTVEETFAGRLARTRRVISNRGGQVIPKGTVVRIGKYVERGGRVSISCRNPNVEKIFEPRRYAVSGIETWDLELLPEKPKKPKTEDELATVTSNEGGTNDDEADDDGSCNEESN